MNAIQEPSEPVSPYTRVLVEEYRRLCDGVLAELPRASIRDQQAFVAIQHELLDDFAAGRRTLDLVAAHLVAVANTIRALPAEQRCQQQLATANHEAGHAVVALKVGIAIDSATALPPPIGTSSGFVKLSEGSPTDAAWDDAARLVLERYAVIDLAGPAAEDAFGSPGADRENWERHRADARRTLLPIRPFVGDRAFAAHVAALEERARSLVAANWPAINAVRDALLERDRLTADEVKDIMERAERGVCR